MYDFIQIVRVLKISESPYDRRRLWAVCASLFQTTMSVSEEPGAEPSPSITPDPFQEEQTVIILVGLIASGKVEPATPFA